MDNTGYQSPFIAEIYDYVVPYRSRRDVPFFVDAAKEFGAPVLELGCGTGRVLIATARAGIEIVGLDASEHMLKVCRRNLSQESEKVRARVGLERGEMQHFELPEKFRLATIPFRPFQHLIRTEDQLSCLSCVHKHLSDAGRLILDIYNPWIHRFAEDNLGREFGEEPEFTLPDGRKIIRRHRTVARDLFNQINDEETIFDVTYADGSKERIIQPFQMRYLYRFEAEHLLARCGFRLERVYADYDKNRYGSKYPGELIMIAKKA